MKYDRFHDIGKLENHTFCPNCLSDKNIYSDPNKSTFDQNKVVCKKCGFGDTWFRVRLLTKYHAKRLIAEKKFISNIQKIIKRDLNEFEFRYCQDRFYDGEKHNNVANKIKDAYKEDGKKYMVTVKISKGWPGLYGYKEFEVIAINEDCAKNRIYFSHGFFGLSPMDITYYCEQK